MYAETGIFFPYMQNYAQEIHQLDEYCKSNEPSSQMNNFADTCMISDYDLGGGDLFKAPEPLIIEEPTVELDPVTAAITMINEDVETIQREQELINDVFHECEKDIMANSALSQVLDMNIPVDENQMQKNTTLIEKSFSSGSLNSMEPGMNLDFGAGMRRAYSEGDIKTLGSGQVTFVQSSTEKPSVTRNCTSEARLEKLSRYRIKKKRRNFDRKIKYACRKALADTQPRVRGRFAKPEEIDVFKNP